MNFLHQINNIFQKNLSNQFIRNLGWLGMAEIFYRVLRLGLVVIIARFLTPYDYGLGAVIFAVREFAITFAEVGICAKIIQAEEQELNDLCNSAYWLNWLIFVGLFIIQCLAAFPISWLQNTQEIILPICVLGTAYLLWPLAAIQRILIQRENRFKIIAFNDTIQNSLATILSAIFAVLGMGVWAFALPPVLVVPLEIIIFLNNHSWRPQTGFTTKYWKQIWNFGQNILAINLLRTFRNNLDYLIIFVCLGVKELGIYFFGFNAGLGISLSIINAMKSAILPHLCAVRTEQNNLQISYLKSLRIISLVIIPFVLFQSSFAYFYVPIIFGQKWIIAVPIVILICLSAIPRPFADAASQLLIAIGKPHLDLQWNVLFTTIFAVALLFGVHWHIIGVATSVLLVHLICLPLFTLWTTRYVFPQRVM